MARGKTALILSGASEPLRNVSHAHHNWCALFYSRLTWQPNTASSDPYLNGVLHFEVEFTMVIIDKIYN